MSVKNRYDIVKKLGEGGFGVVYLAKKKKSNKYVAIKLIKITKNNQHRILAETKSLQTIKPKCVPYLACYRNSFIDKSKNVFVIEMDYIEGKTISVYTQGLRNAILSKYQRNQSYEKERLKLVTISKLLLITMLKTLKYLNSKNIIHNDIKPSNIMVNNKRNTVLVDFGLACFKNKDNYCKNKAGSSLYMPPEILYGVKNPTSDLWSLGATVYSIMTGENVWGVNPYGQTVVKNVLKNIKNKTKPKRLNSGDVQLDSVVNGFLQLDPNKRMTIEKALKILL